MKINIVQNCTYFEYIQYHNKLPEIFFSSKTQIKAAKISINNRKYPISLISAKIKGEVLYKYRVDFSNSCLNEEDAIKLLNNKYNFNVESNSLRIFSLNTGSFEEKNLLKVDDAKPITIKNTQKFEFSHKDIKILSNFTRVFKQRFCYPNICFALQLPMFICENGFSYIKKLKSFNLGQTLYKYFLLTQYSVDVTYTLGDILCIQDMTLRMACDFNQEINIKESLEITNNHPSTDTNYLSWHLIRYTNEQAIMRLVEDKKEFIKNPQKDFAHDSYFLTSNLGKKFIKFMHKYTQLYQALQNTETLTLTLHLTQLIPVGTYVQIQGQNYLVFESHCKIGANYLSKIVLKRLLADLPPQVKIKDSVDTKMFKPPSFSLANKLPVIKYTIPKAIDLKISSSDEELHISDIYENIELNLDIYENSEEKCELTHIQLMDDKVYFVFNNRFNKLAPEDDGLHKKLIEINSIVEQQAPTQLQIGTHMVRISKMCVNLFKVLKS